MYLEISLEKAREKCFSIFDLYLLFVFAGYSSSAFPSEISFFCSGKWDLACRDAEGLK